MKLFVGKRAIILLSNLLVSFKYRTIACQNYLFETWLKAWCAGSFPGIYLLG